MRVPGRFHITWQDDNTLRIESDAGMQSRALHFAPSAPASERTWQGDSTARWDAAGQSLTVTTANMRAGYLRWNGVPYSENATMTEYIDLAPLPDGGQLLVVTTTVRDARFLAAFVRRELAFQAGREWVQMESDAVHVAVVNTVRLAGTLVFAGLSVLRSSRVRRSRRPMRSGRSTSASG